MLISVIKEPLHDIIGLYLLILYLKIPLKRNVDIGFGFAIDNSWPSNGWVWTQGNNGIIDWDGTFFGQLGTRQIFPYIHACISAISFSGIRIQLLHPSLGTPSTYLDMHEILIINSSAKQYIFSIFLTFCGKFSEDIL